MLLLIQIFSIVAFFGQSFAQQKTFPTCQAWQGRTELEGFCPRLEGVTLPKCCPPLEKKPALKCHYQIVRNQGQLILTNSSYTTCNNGTTMESHDCCAPSAEACYTDPVSLDFTARLIHRDKACCFEVCPPGSYWRTPPNPEPRITSEHELVSSNLAICTSQVINRCTIPGNPTCQASQVCPAPPSPPSPPAPTNPTTPTPTNPTSPGPNPPMDGGGGGGGGGPAPSPPEPPAPVTPGET